MTYDDSLTVKEALALYFESSGFDERTYTAKWVELPVLGRTLYLPNLGARKKVVPFHDIDHVLTEYGTSWPEEFQISSYEIGTGCGRYPAAWGINLQALLAGAFRNPRECIRAFSRGRRSRGVYSFSSHEPLLSENLGELRKRTTFRGDLRPTFSDVALFGLAAIGSVILNFGPVVLVGFLIYQIFFVLRGA